MIDITVCTNKECSQRGECYRAKFPVDSPWQSYAYFAPTDGTCDYFWSLKPLTRQEEMKNIKQSYDESDKLPLEILLAIGELTPEEYNYITGVNNAK